LRTATAGAEKHGVFLPSEAIRLYLLSRGVSLNLPNVVDLAEACRRQKLEEAKFGMSFGILQRRPRSVLWREVPTSIRVGGYVEGPAANWWILSIAPYVGYQMVGGYQRTALGRYPRDSGAFAEAIGELGASVSIRISSVALAIPLRWSPSLLVLDQDLDFAFAFPSYAAGARLTVGTWGMGIGADVRKVSPPGQRSAFVESSVYATLLRL
jgi:hypothetical protein